MKRMGMKHSYNRQVMGGTVESAAKKSGATSTKGYGPELKKLIMKQGHNAAGSGSARAY